MGDNNLNSIEDDLGSYIRRIRRTHVHPRYEGGGKSPAYYDVAIWEVTPRITYNSYVRPVCLPAASSSFADKYEGFAATVTGKKKN